MKKTKIKFQSLLNDLGIPKDDLKSNGGQIPDHARYGNWIKHHDKVAFEVGFNEWLTE